MVALVAACLGMGMVSNEQKLEYHLMNSSTSSQGVVSSGFAPVGVVMNNRLMNSSRSSSQGMVSSGFGPAVHPISYPPFPPHVDHAPPPSITTCRPPSPTRRSGTTPRITTCSPPSSTSRSHRRRRSCIFEFYPMKPTSSTTPCVTIWKPPCHIDSMTHTLQPSMLNLFSIN